MDKLLEYKLDRLEEDVHYLQELLAQAMREILEHQNEYHYRTSDEFVALVEKQIGTAYKNLKVAGKFNRYVKE